MKNNKISVIILTKNSQKHIEKCLKSVYMQKYPDFEVIIVDSESIDNTKSILIDYDARYGYRTPTYIIYAPSDVTIGKARQIGLEQARGDIIAWIDSDVELSHEHWFENMAKPLIDGCTFAVPFTKISGTQTLSKTKKGDPWILKHLHKSFEYKNKVIDIDNYEMVGTGHCLIKRNCIDEVGGVPDVWSLEDITMTKKIMENGYKFIYLSEEKVYHYHVDSFWHYIKKHWFRNKYNVLRRYLFERNKLNK